MTKIVRPPWQWFMAGLLAALLVAALVVGFVAYQSPAMLLDWANLRYCG